MKRLILFIAFVATTLFASCEKKVSEPFSFSLVTETVQHGATLPVSVVIKNGPHAGYTMSSHVDLYDVVTETSSKTPHKLLWDGKPADSFSIGFEPYGKREFYVEDLEPGTYIIYITLTLGAQSQTNSVMAVVLNNGSGTDPVVPPVTPDEKPIDSFEINGIETGADGVLSLDMGQERKFLLTWSPADADYPTFSVESSDDDVVAASIVGNYVVLRPVGPGEAKVVVSEAGGCTKTLPVRVKAKDIPIESFEIEGLELSGDYLVLKDNDIAEYRLSYSPSGATKTKFIATVGDDSILSAAASDGKLVVSALYPGRTSLTISAEDGPTKTIPVKVYKDVKVTVEWEEFNATDAQINTKTFPCYLKFSSDSDKAFPTPITWTVTMKGVVNVTGRDTQSHTSKQDVKFYGNKEARYDVCTNVLIPCYSIYRTSLFTLSLTLSVQMNHSLDSEYWKLSFDEKYKNQDARISQYITEIQQ